MNLSFRQLAPGAALFALLGVLLGAPAAANAQSFSPPQRSEIEVIIHEYLISHPEVLQEAMAELEKRQAAADLAKHQAAIKDNAGAIFSSPHQVVLGNPQGDTTMVEFFDYNCGFCKRAMADMFDLLKSDPKLKIVLKEWPVLSDGSVEAAHVAVAVRMQDPKKYLDFHQRLLGGRGVADAARALAVAKEIGLDVARIEKDAKGPEATATLAESFHIADALGLSGTPSYVIGNEVVVGAVGLASLKEKINTARCGKATC
jgi:protein-disulfide isomerase